VIVDIVLILFSILFFDIKMLWNTQIGFLSASLVMLASMGSYKRMVDARVEKSILAIDDSRDTIEKLEDPYDLYSEASKEEREKEIYDTLKEEKARLKRQRRSIMQTARDTKAALSLHRIVAYVVLVVGFFYLNRHGLLDIPSYLLALGIPSVVIVVLLFKEKEIQIKDTLQ